MNKSLRYTIFIALCGLTALLYFLFTPVVTKPQGAIFLVRPGMSKPQLITQLSVQNIVTFPRSLYLYGHPQRFMQLKAGEYLFPAGSTVISIYKQMISGVGLVYYQFTIIPGRSFAQLRRQLNQSAQLRHFTSKLTDEAIMFYLGATNVAPEGEFFPETYNYTRDTSDLVILKRAYDLMQVKFNEAWQHRAADLLYQKPYQALIAASLIEKEAYLNSERPIISGVIINRLKKNMLLQIDPTVIYGLGQRYDGKIYKQNLLEDTPYNTYVHKGLPPTPIAMPSMLSIEAALHPQQHDYLYFVAKGNGAHQFSKTLAEHHIAVQAAIKPRAGTFNEAVVRSYMQELIWR